MTITSADKGRELKQRGIIVCGSSVAIFGPALTMMSRRGTNSIILMLIAACWIFDIALGIWFIVRGNKLIQEGGR
jgi:hypothetical protein